MPFLFALLCAFLLSGPCVAATVTVKYECLYSTIDNSECEASFYIDGPIDASTPEQFLKAKDDVIAAERSRLKNLEAPSTWIVRLNSDGGSVESALVLGKIVRDLSMVAIVPAGGRCTSACVFVFAGGVTRAANGLVGIHRPYLSTVPADSSTKGISTLYEQGMSNIRKYLREMNVSERLADDMMNVRPERMRFLTLQELDGYGLGLIDPIFQESRDLQGMKKYGLTRLEYMRRRRAAEDQCREADYPSCLDRHLREGK